MPVKPDYPFADTPHPATIASPDYRYGCHSLQTGDARPRGKPGQYIAHPWADAPTEVVETSWLPIPCGHEGRARDSACIGCANQLRGEGAPSESEATREPEPELSPPGPGLAGQIYALARAISPPAAAPKPARKFRDLHPGSISEQVLACLQGAALGWWFTSADFKTILGPRIREAHIHSAMRRLKARGLVEERLVTPAPGKRTKREWRLTAAAVENSSPETVDKPAGTG